ncbi:hypothetical protein TSOC_014964, partial [Tetrabaena socialis]
PPAPCCAGEVLRCELLLHNRGAHAHTLAFSLAAVNCVTAAPQHAQHDAQPYHHHHHHQVLHPQLAQQYQQPPYMPYGQQQQQPLPYGQQQQQPVAFGQQHRHTGSGSFHAPGHAHAMSQTAMQYGATAQQAAAMYGAPYYPPGAAAPPPYYQARHPRTYDGHTTVGSAASGQQQQPQPYPGYGPYGAAAPHHASAVQQQDAANAAGAAEHGIDPGVVLVGAVHNVHVAVEARSTGRHPFALTFAHPGLYQLFVHEVAAVPQGADAGLWAAGRQGQAPTPQRVYASVDRLTVLCT